MMRTLLRALLALALLASSGARAATIFFDVTGELINGAPLAGTVSVDDADFAPDADVPLQSLDITFDLGTLFTFQLVECAGSAQGRVDAAGNTLVGLSGVCIDTGVVNDPTASFAPDGTLTFTPFDLIVSPIPGTYEVAAQLPEPALPWLIAASLLALLPSRRPSA